MKLNPRDATPCRRKESAPEQPSPPYTAIPDSVLQSAVYINLPAASVRLLVELAMQHDGYNNGMLFASYRTLAKRGMRCHATVEQSFDQLVAAGVLVKTRNACRETNSAALYALTWLPVSRYNRDGSLKDMPLLPHPYPMHKYLTVQPVIKEVRLKGAVRRKQAAKVAREVLGGDGHDSPVDVSTTPLLLSTGTTVYVPPSRTGRTRKTPKNVPPDRTGCPAQQDRLPCIRYTPIPPSGTGRVCSLLLGGRP